MKKEIRTFYGKLNEIEKRIPENVFLRIHKSYLVNKNYVKEFTYEELYLWIIISEYIKLKKRIAI